MFSVLLASLLSKPVADQLPDISLLPSYLAQAYVTTSNPELPSGTKALRFPTASVNLGLGRLEMRGGEVVGQQQRVYQRVYRTDGSFYDRAAGWFIYHPTHGHIHFESWTQFILRKRNKDGGIGDVVATGAKTSFCILEIVEWDTSIAGHNTQPSYGSCGQIQGLRPGWSDVYGSTLDGQYINLTGVADGDYYLEGYIDPNSQVLESNENNNTVLVPISIGNPPTAQPDPYESNNTIAEVDAKPEGAVNSPNLGMIRKVKSYKNLSMTDTADWFKFRTAKLGTAGDFVKIESGWARTGNLDFELYSSAGTLLTRSAQSYNFEQISMQGRAAGTYYVKVIRSNATNNPNYWLTVDMTSGNPPYAQVDAAQGDSPGGTVYVEKAYETIPINWTYLTEQTKATEVSLFKSKTKDVADGIAIDGYEGTPGHVKAANILTNQFTTGKWHIFARFSSGKAHTDVWKKETFVVYRKGDTDLDGKVTVREAQTLYHDYLKTGKQLPEGWDKICDMDSDGKVTVKDYQMMYLLAEHGE